MSDVTRRLSDIALTENKAMPLPIDAINAGTRQENGCFVTGMGRVLGPCAPPWVPTSTHEITRHIVSSIETIKVETTNLAGISPNAMDRINAVVLQITTLHQDMNRLVATLLHDATHAPYQSSVSEQQTPAQYALKGKAVPLTWSSATWFPVYPSFPTMQERINQELEVASHLLTFYGVSGDAMGLIVCYLQRNVDLDLAIETSALQAAIDKQHDSITRPLKLDDTVRDRIHGERFLSTIGLRLSKLACEWILSFPQLLSGYKHERFFTTKSFVLITSISLGYNVPPTRIRFCYSVVGGSLHEEIEITPTLHFPTTDGGKWHVSDGEQLNPEMWTNNVHPGIFLHENITRIRALLTTECMQSDADWSELIRLGVSAELIVLIELLHLHRASAAIDVLSDSRITPVMIHRWKLDNQMVPATLRLVNSKLGRGRTPHGLLISIVKCLVQSSGTISFPLLKQRVLTSFQGHCARVGTALASFLDLVSRSTPKCLCADTSIRTVVCIVFTIVNEHASWQLHVVTST